MREAPPPRISCSYLSKIETGAPRYDQSVLEAAAEALSCRAGDLLR